MDFEPEQKAAYALHLNPFLSLGRRKNLVPFRDEAPQSNALRGKR